MLIYTLVIYTHCGEKLGFTKAALNTDVLYTNPHCPGCVCVHSNLRFDAQFLHRAQTVVVNKCTADKLTDTIVKQIAAWGSLQAD